MSSDDSVTDEKATDAADGADESPAKPMGCLARIIPVSTPGCASALTLVFLMTTVISVWGVFWLDPINIPWRHGYSWLRIFTILSLIVAIPWVVYKTVQSWLEGPRRAFPELDIAWQAGINALAANELTPKDIPLFVVLGTSCEAQERAMMDATGMSFSVEGVPHGPAPIHWYANAEAIYLFCSDASWVSALASLREELSSEQPQVSPDMDFETVTLLQQQTITVEPWGEQETNPPASLSETSKFAPSPTLPVSMSAPIRGTLELDGFVDPKQRSFAAPVSTEIPSNGLPTGQISGQSPMPATYRGTLIFDDGNPSSQSLASPQEPRPSLQPSVNPQGFQQDLPPSQPQGFSLATSQSHSDASRVQLSSTYAPAHGHNLGAAPALLQTNRKPILVSHRYSSACLQELAYLGSRLRRERQPLCSINGVLTVLQLEAIHSSPAELEELTKAIRSDLETIQYACQIRCPVTAMVVGLEKERGFRELVRRVGKERALSQRFGKRFDVNAIPTYREMASLSTLACSAFEDWTYSLFREEQALSKPGNTKLYELLSKVRCNWRSRLSTILSQGFGCDESEKSSRNSLLFSGCYFAGTGQTADRQAFVKGVVEKLNEEQEFIEWTPDALWAHKLQTRAASLGMLVTALLLIALLVMLLVHNSNAL